MTPFQYLARMKHPGLIRTGLALAALAVVVVIALAGLKP